MNKIKRSLRLLRAALAVLRREKKLLFIPVIGSGLAVAAAMFFILPVVLYPTGHPFFSAAHWSALAGALGVDANQAHGVHTAPLMVGKNGIISNFFQNWWAAPLMTMIYLTSMFLATFSNVAFYHEIIQALNGRTVSIRRGLRFALGRWRAVLLWSLFAGLVGYIIQTIQARLGIFGRLVTSLIGVVWSVACIFIIPTLVRDAETSNPVKLLGNSARTLKCTWGEVVIGFAGLEMVSGIIFLLAMGAFVGLEICGYALGLKSSAELLGLILAGGAGFFGIAIILSWLSGAVNSIYRCALYIYATEGVIPGTFDKELLDSAWKVK